MEIETTQKLSRMFRTALFVAAAVLAALPVYILAVEILKGRGVRLGPSLAAGTANALRYGLYGAAVAAVILLRVLRGMIIRKRPGDSPDRRAQKLLQASILTSVLSEVPALLGVVLFLVAGFYRDFYILLIVSLFLMFMFFPRYRNWSEWAGEP
jgi:hypothetical protein